MIGERGGVIGSTMAGIRDARAAYSFLKSDTQVPPELSKWLADGASVLSGMLAGKSPEPWIKEGVSIAQELSQNFTQRVSALAGEELHNGIQEAQAVFTGALSKELRKYLGSAASSVSASAFAASLHKQRAAALSWVVRTEVTTAAIVSRGDATIKLMQKVQSPIHQLCSMVSDTDSGCASWQDAMKIVVDLLKSFEAVVQLTVDQSRMLQGKLSKVIKPALQQMPDQDEALLDMLSQGRLAEAAMTVESVAETSVATVESPAKMGETRVESLEELVSDLLKKLKEAISEIAALGSSFKMPKLPEILSAATQAALQAATRTLGVAFEASIKSLQPLDDVIAQAISKMMSAVKTGREHAQSKVYDFMTDSRAIPPELEDWLGEAPEILREYINGNSPDEWIMRGVEIAGKTAQQIVERAADLVESELEAGLDEIQKTISGELAQTLQRVTQSGIPGQIEETGSKSLEQLEVELKIANAWVEKAETLLAVILAKAKDMNVLLEKQMEPLEQMRETINKYGGDATDGIEEFFDKLMSVPREIANRLALAMQAIRDVLGLIAGSIRPVVQQLSHLVSEAKTWLRSGATHKASMAAKCLVNTSADQAAKFIESTLTDLIQTLKEFATTAVAAVASFKVPAFPTLPKEIQAALASGLSAVESANKGIMSMASKVDPSLAKMIGEQGGVFGVAKDGFALLRKRGGSWKGNVRNRMARWQLPGDEHFVADFKAVKNFRPLLFWPAFIIMILSEANEGYMLPAVYSNGTPYSDWSGLSGGSKVDPEIAAIKRLSPMLSNKTLTCAFGTPAKMRDDIEDIQCPMIYGFMMGFIPPLVWPLPFLFIVLYCYWQGGELPRMHGQSRIGRYLSMYGSGMRDCHLWAFVLNLLLVWLHSMVSRIAVFASEYKCMSYYDWGDADPCYRVGVMETTLTTVLPAGAFAVFSATLSDHGAPPCKPKVKTVDTEKPEIMDKRTAAAVRMKGLVRRQWLDTKGKKANPGMSLRGLPLEMLKLLMSVFKDQLDDEMEEVSDFMEDFGEQVDSLADELRDIDLDGFKDMAQAAFQQETLGIMNPAAIKAAEGRLKNALEVAEKKAMAAVEVKVNEIVADVKKGELPFDSSLCRVSPFAMIGFLVGVLFTAAMILYSSPVAFDVHEYISPRYDCVKKGNLLSDCLDDVETNSTGNPWRYVRWEAASAYYKPFTEEVQAIKKTMSFPLIVCALVKILSCGISVSILFITANETKKGLEEAAMPMEILGSILNRWVLEGDVKTNQLNAWWDARRSLLYNEVAMTLDKFENVVVGYIFAAMLLVTVDVVNFVIQKRSLTVMSLPLAFLFSLCAWSCMQSGLKCHHAQKNHITLLVALQRAMVSNKPESKRIAETVDKTIKVMETRDYQTKLFYIPLNPAFLAAVSTYVASGLGSIVYTVFQRQG